MISVEQQIKNYIKSKEPTSVCVHYNDELGEWVWAVVVHNTDFWLDSFQYKKDAVAYCKKHGLKIMAIKKD